MYIEFEEVEHPDRLLYRHIPTNSYYTPAGIEDGEIIWQPVNLVYHQEQIEQPVQMLQIPRYSQSRREQTIEAELISEIKVSSPKKPGGDPFSSALSRMPLDQKILFTFIASVLVLFAIATPVTPLGHQIARVVQNTFSPPVATQKATDRLVRISQLDASQYDSSSQFASYGPSACSAASLTAVFNSYGGSYKIGTVLDTEISEGVISPTLGLIGTDGIVRTANRFGFDVNGVSSLDQAIDAVNNGTPVIINLRPSAYWTTGHFLVLLGSDSNGNVKLSDSSKMNYTLVEKGKFDEWRNGGAMYAVSPSRYSLLQGRPTLSSDQVNAVLAANHSPMAGEGQLFVDDSIAHHVDDAFVVSIYKHEGDMGRAGEMTVSLSPGNLRCPTPDWTGGWCSGGYEWFHSWDDGLKSLYILLSGSVYSGAGNNTPETVIPVFAPSSDNNSPTTYIKSLKSSIDSLRAGSTQL